MSFLNWWTFELLGNQLRLLVVLTHRQIHQHIRHHIACLAGHFISLEWHYAVGKHIFGNIPLMPEIIWKLSQLCLKLAHRWLACFYVTSLTFLAWYIMYEAIIFKHMYRHWQDDRISDPWYFAIEQMCSNSTAICCCDKDWKMSQSSNLNPKTDHLLWCNHL